MSFTLSATNQEPVTMEVDFYAVTAATIVGGISFFLAGYGLWRYCRKKDCIEDSASESQGYRLELQKGSALINQR